MSCLLLVVAGAALCYAGLLLDERTLMAAVIAIMSMIVLSLAVAVAQWVAAGSAGWESPAVGVVETASRTGRGRDMCTRMARLLRPSDVTATALHERIDQYGNVVDRWTGDLPRERGLYRRVGTMPRWRSPFGLFVVRRRLAAAGETPILPETVQEPSSGIGAAARGKAAGLSDTEESGAVRAYEPGDPIKRISWRHSAHRGRLMTRESDGDDRATLLLVVNADGADGVDAQRLDGAVATLLPYVRARRGTDVMATDGVRVAEGTQAVTRFLAAVRPTCGVSDASCGGSAETCGVSPATCAVSVGNTVRRRSGPVEVLVCDASDSNGLAQSLRRSHIGAAVRILDPTPHERVVIAHVPPETAHVVPETPQLASETPHVTPAPPLVTSVIPVARVAAPRIVAAASLLAYFGIMLKGLAGLVEPTGLWAWFAAGALAIAALASSVPAASVRAALIRVSAYALAVGIAASVAVLIRLHGMAPVSTSSKASPASSSAVSFAESLSRGFDRLNRQLPPLKVAPASDVLLIVVIAVVALLVRCLLLWHRSAPFFVLLPVAALAADYAMLGHVAPWWAVALLAAAFPMGLWAAGAERPCRPTASPAKAIPRSGSGAAVAPRPATRILPSVCAALTVMAVTLAGTPAAESLAYRIPLSIGEGGGMFSSNTVSPLIDLKRNISAGSDSVVLSYSSYRRVYLKMTTLDEFDGDTWGYGKDIALDAGLYGSGIRLGRDQSDDLDMDERRAPDPLTLYMWMLGYAGYDVAGVDENTLERFMGYAKVHVDTLRSRFLPVPGSATDIAGVGSDWLRYRDGSVYNRVNATSADMTYTASGTYLEPISSAAGFADLDIVRRAGEDFAQRRRASDDQVATWIEARRSLAGSGLGEVRDGFAVIRATVGKDGVVRGPHDWRLGRVSVYRMSLDGGRGGEIGDGTASDHGSSGGDAWENGSETTIGAPSGISFDDTVAAQLGLGKEGTAYGFDADGSTAVIVLPLRDVSDEDAATESGSGGVSGGANGWSGSLPDWARTATGLITREGASVATVVDAANASDDGQRMMRRLDDMVRRSDDDAHAGRYTSLPKSLPANVRAVIRRAQADGVPVTGKDYDAQVRAMRWLVGYFTAKDNRFSYSLDAPDGDGRSNMQVIDDFLDPKTGHKGYCQHYASALAVLGRAMGVPTRVVLGYNAGASPRGADGYYQVRSRQLHAWVEAYLDGVGWVPFDATPASEQNGTLAADGASASGEDSSDAASGAAEGSPDASGMPADASGGDSGSSDGADAKTQTKDGDDGSKDGNGGDARRPAGASASTGAGAYGPFDPRRWGAWFVGLTPPGRVAAAAAGLALLAALVFAPRAWRDLRRRRCLAMAVRAAAFPDDAAARSRAWREAWSLIRREGRRRGARWRACDTDMMIADAIARVWNGDARSDAGGMDGEVSDDVETGMTMGVGVGVEGVRNANAGNAGAGRTGGTAAEAIRVIARNAAAAAFGGSPAPAAAVAELLERLLAGRGPRPIRSRHADAKLSDDGSGA
ncbi:transglutaminaseTgpA domain-containing protein [Bifidobacterium platyrrhinorum]|uniref:transglutaminaseTgpA domain-containing protein n=1 Tax=Bifidobacterium platyrrhinorum TaxID=2661628 RepID=UPI0013D45CB1|nr:transglutaminaseTgpA domain-containing protein [Bifidobacterium platyrrhinorum]